MIVHGRAEPCFLPSPERVGPPTRELFGVVGPVIATAL